MLSRTLDVDPHRSTTMVVARSARVLRFFVILAAAFPRALWHFLDAICERLELKRSCPPVVGGR